MGFRAPCPPGTPGGANFYGKNPGIFTLGPAPASADAALTAGEEGRREGHRHGHQNSRHEEGGEHRHGRHCDADTKRDD